jgi:hypothetical protein
MPREAIKTIIDLSDSGRKRDLIRCVGCMTGLYSVEIKPTRPFRSLQQNRFYFGVICTAFSKYLTAQDYDVTDVETAHEILRGRFLAVTLKDPKTGSPIGRFVRSTASLDTAEFGDYMDRCRAWLADFFGIITEDPDPSWRIHSQPAGKAD